jgi:large subunit ribosomal protein L16|tara:strand:+ start:95 stop:538 length:444 start_codon:yes stop_codon:yes gene_type:complete
MGALLLINYLMLFPKKTKFKKQHKGKNLKIVNQVFELNRLNFGSVGLKSISVGRLTSKQIESMCQSINKIIKRFGRLTLNIFPDTPVSKKPIEVRMGKGKGNVSYWVYKVKSGTLLCEVETSSIQLGLKALKTAQYRLPIKTKIIFN